MRKEPKKRGKARQSGQGNGRSRVRAGVGRDSRPPAGRRRQGAATPLERGRIVAAALAIVDREGLKALSMRRLGAELGVDPMAVYYHLPNKQALLDAIVEAVMATIDLSVDDPGRPAEERILAAARAYCGALAAHANALPILLAHGPVTPAALRPVELLVGILRDAGLPPAESLAGMNLIAAAVRGAVGMGGIDEPSNEEFDEHWRRMASAEFPRLSEAMAASPRSFEEFFEFGIRAVARGLLTRTELP
ncbi:MAG: TetR/AcrR family transcriptional regulator [Terracidiphilus sp.]